MTLKEAELLSQAGTLKKPIIRQDKDDWVVILDGTHKLNPMLETAWGQVRVFKRLDEAEGGMFEIGFVKIRVIR